MKKIIILLLLAIQIVSFAQNQKVPWDFPVKPGSEEWKDLSNEKERFEAQQIPIDIMTNIPTDELIKSCINLPSFGFYRAFDTPQTGFLILAHKFNGLRELSKRKDALIELVKIYQVTNESGFGTSTIGINSNYWSLRFGWIELMISQKKFLEQGTSKEMKELIKICIDKYNMKLESKRFSTSGAELTLFLMSRILGVAKNQAYENECLKRPYLKEFSNNSKMINSDTSKKILSLSQQFVIN